MARTVGSKGAKGSTSSQAGKPEVVKLKITVGRETARVLRLEAFGRDCSLGQLVEELVRAQPRRFTLVDRGSKGLQGLDGSNGPVAPNVQEPRGEVRTLGLARDTG